MDDIDLLKIHIDLEVNEVELCIVYQKLVRILEEASKNGSLLHTAVETKRSNIELCAVQ